jgi:anti-sigma28 factor (negative regulator of flagellin synthesis)
LDYTVRKNKTSFPEGPAKELTREARVQAIKEAIAAGTYRIDDRNLADCLLSALLQAHWEKMRLKKQ